LKVVLGFAARSVSATRHLQPAALLKHSNCAGHERWTIKVLKDDDANKLNKTAKTTTVDELRANDTRPAKVSAEGGRIKPVEFRRYRVHATLRKAIREDDGDLHVVISDPHHDAEADPEHTMIIEFPDTTCEPQNSSDFAPQMEKARAAFVALVKRCTNYTGKFSASSSCTPRSPPSASGTSPTAIRSGVRAQARPRQLPQRRPDPAQQVDQNRGPVTRNSSLPMRSSAGEEGSITVRLRAAGVCASMLSA
jgi:hypothetical protein